MPAKTPGSRRSESSRPTLCVVSFLENGFKRNSQASLDLGLGVRDEPIEASGGKVCRDLAIPAIIG